jgi:hypothetical protein
LVESVDVELMDMEGWLYHRLGGLNNRHLFLIVLEARKPKVKVLTDWVLGRAHLLVCG